MGDDRSIHERAIELAVSELDFPLQADEHSWVATHLDGCSTCRLEIDRYARDARAIARLPLASAPAAVEARVLGTGRVRAHHPGGLRRLAAVTAAALVLVVAGIGVIGDRLTDPSAVGSMAPTASAGAAPSPSLGSVIARPTSSSVIVPPDPSGAPATTPPTPGASAPATAGPPLRWQEVDVPPAARAQEIRATAVRGDRALATLVGDAGEPRLWWSDVGRSWGDAELPAGAFGGAAPWLVEPFRDGFVALGWTDFARSIGERRVWLSPDGLAWRPNVNPSGTLGSLTQGVLAASDSGVLVAGRSPDDDERFWWSANGEDWSPLTVSGEVRNAQLDALASDGAAFYAYESEGQSVRLWRSEDGGEWSRLTSPAGLATLHGLVAASGGLVAYGATAPGGVANMVVWSPDGRRWEAVTMRGAPGAPNDRIVRLAGSDRGLLAVWRLADGTTLYAESGDGRTWRARDAEGLPDAVELEQVDRVGSVLVALGRDARDRLVAFSAALTE